MAGKVSTHLMFEGTAEEAMNFYVSLFKSAEITSIERYASNKQGKEGTVKRANFILGGHNLIRIDSPVKHDFSFTPSISIFVECESESELEEMFAQLSAEGKIYMPLNDYGFSTKFAWVSDRFRVSWQLNLQ